MASDSDLGRYRIAIEDEDVRDRQTWADVKRTWYSRAAEKPSSRLWQVFLSVFGTGYSNFILGIGKSIGQGGCRSIGAMSFMANLQVVSASESTTSSNPTPLLRDTALLDYIIYGSVLPSMALLWYIGPRTTQPSFVITLLFAFLWLAAVNTSSLLDIRTT
ncbi:hypothetical protein P153DRAFT_149903 [Dothidotthia symphoricarpi CBS 119687]|uniref:Uncharacterized protein n=1 Tax=Dothidotthia symphoricarpi CBS 119687 TaxID=1392245 RepID=A0A6A6APQ4_9PLEO|nr:uncharacterized protein P153DRAFT_149903 [Dothidotthia symphoricarpi CBS 119687]KAF2133138.1 hypothetical protein P153DRAFT_149903 [Dothidotthia symphoricarpi CBS 119687]